MYLYVGCILSSKWVIGFCRSMAVAFHFRKIRFFHNFALHSTHSHTPLTQTHTHTLDKPMNSARGRVLDQSGTCFTTMWDRLTKTTETAKRKGEKRILEKWEAHWDKSWRRLRQKRARTENKRENEMTNFTEENLEHCLQSQVSCVCNCEGQCTGHCSAIKVAALTVLVCSSYCQNWVCVCVCVLDRTESYQTKKCMKAGESAATKSYEHVRLWLTLVLHDCLMKYLWGRLDRATVNLNLWMSEVNPFNYSCKLESKNAISNDSFDFPSQFENLNIYIYLHICLEKILQTRPNLWLIFKWQFIFESWIAVERLQ